MHHDHASFHYNNVILQIKMHCVERKIADGVLIQHLSGCLGAFE